MLSHRGTWALELGLSSCGTQAWLLCSMWDLPGPGIEPICHALAGGFLTTGLPGKSCNLLLACSYFLVNLQLEGNLVMNQFCLIF